MLGVGSLLLAWPFGCGRALYDPQSAVDAAVGTDDDAGIDAAAARDGAALADGELGGDAGVPIECGDWSDGAFAFDSIDVLTALDGPTSEDQPQLARDGLTLYFASECELYRAVRPTIADPFVAPTRVAFTATDCILGANVGEDGLRAIVMLDSEAGTMADLWEFSRADLATPLAPVASLDAVNSSVDDWDGFLTADGLELYGARGQVDGSTTIWRTQRADRGSPFDAPVFLDGLNTGWAQANPSLTDDHRIMVINYVAAEGEASALHYAVRSARGEPFSGHRPVPGLEAIASAGEPFVTTSGCEIYFVQRPFTGAPGELSRARYRRL
jgi:hypothetical protein